MYTQLILRHFFKMSKQIYGRLIEHNVNCTVHTVYKDVCHVSMCYSNSPDSVSFPHVSPPQRYHVSPGRLWPFSFGFVLWNVHLYY